MHFTRTISDPSYTAQNWHAQWNGADNDLYMCWERGVAKAKENPLLAEAASRNELVPLPWKGGIEKVTKQIKRYGTFYYLATWQGLRGEPLDIDTSLETPITCAKTGMTVYFTADLRKYAQQE